MRGGGSWWGSLALGWGSNFDSDSDSNSGSWEGVGILMILIQILEGVVCVHKMIISICIN